MTQTVAPNAGPGTNTGYECPDRAVTGACVTYTATDGALITPFTVQWPTLCAAWRHVQQLAGLPWISEIGVAVVAPTEAREGMDVSSQTQAARCSEARGLFLAGDIQAASRSSASISLEITPHSGDAPYRPYSSPSSVRSEIPSTSAASLRERPRAVRQARRVSASMSGNASCPVEVINRRLFGGEFGAVHGPASDGVVAEAQGRQGQPEMHRPAIDARHHVGASVANDCQAVFGGGGHLRFSVSAGPSRPDERNLRAARNSVNGKYARLVKYFAALAAIASTVLFAASVQAKAPQHGTEDFDLLMPFEHWVTEQQSRIYHHDDYEGGSSSCCGTADGRTVQARRWPNASGWQVLITKAPDKFPWATEGWRDVPPMAVANVHNPVGLPVVWVTSADVIECFRPASEG